MFQRTPQFGQYARSRLQDRSPLFRVPSATQRVADAKRVASALLWEALINGASCRVGVQAPRFAVGQPSAYAFGTDATYCLD